jgi:cytochrome c peroxidase
VGGALYMKFGLVKEVPNLADEGRFAVTKKAEDRFVFKVPSLRNVEKTGPWFHAGRAKMLDDAISTMATHQLGKTLTKEQVSAIAAFLGSLTGTPPQAALVVPKPLPSGPTTPKPDET